MDTGNSTASKSSEQENAELAVVENAKWIDGILWSMCLVATALILLKALGKREFKWQDITFDTSMAWIVFSILTVAHLYSALLVIRSLRRLWPLADALSRRRLFDKITSTGGAFVRGLVARTQCIDDWTLYVRYKMDYRDPSAWLALGSLPLLVAAITPFSISRAFIWWLILGIILAELNWIIGSHWVIALSDLSGEWQFDEEYCNRNGLEASLYFRKSDRAGIRVIGMQSGGFGFERVGPLVFPFWLVLNAGVMVASVPARIILMIWMAVDRFRNR